MRGQQTNYAKGTFNNEDQASIKTQKCFPAVRSAARGITHSSGWSPRGVLMVAKRRGIYCAELATEIVAVE
jgi:hypothetical protein